MAEFNTLNQSSGEVSSSQIPEIQQATQLADSYLNTGANKLETVATIIGGEGIKKYGVTGENILKVFACVGAYNSWQYLSKKGREHWKYIGLAAVAMIAYRQYSDNSNNSKTNS